MATVCLIRPDGPTNDIQAKFNKWAATTLGEITKYHSLTHDYSALYTTVPRTLNGHVAVSEIVIFYGHGEWDLLAVVDNAGTFVSWFVSSPAAPAIPASSMAGKLIIAIACQAGHKFGPDAITLGATGFVGFNDSVANVPVLGPKRGGKPPPSTHFEDAFTAGPTEVLIGLGLGGLSISTVKSNAAKEMKQRFQTAHDFFKTGAGATDRNAVLARVWAAWNRDHIVAL